MNELVARLTKGMHSVVAERSASAEELRLQIEREFVLLKFPDTRGGTELGSQLDMQQTRLDGADFENGTGQVHLVGNLTLNYDKVQLVADIDLASLKGTGHLVLIEEESASHTQGDNTGSEDSNGSSSKRAKAHNGEDDGELRGTSAEDDMNENAGTKKKLRASKKASGKKKATGKKTAKKKTAKKKTAKKKTAKKEKE